MENYLLALNDFIENVAKKSAAALAPFKVSAPYKRKGGDPRAYDLSFETSGISLDTFVQIDNDDADTIGSVVDNNLEYVKRELFNIYKISSKLENGGLVVNNAPLFFTAEEIANLLNLVPISVGDYLKNTGGHEQYDKSYVYKVGEKFGKEREDVASALQKYYLNLKRNGTAKNNGQNAADNHK